MTFFKAFVFFEKGPILFMLTSTLPASSVNVQRWTPDIGFGKPFFLKGGRPLPCLLCSQRQEGVGSALLVSQECSGIWE